MNIKSVRTFAARLMLGVAYISVTFQWLWVLLIGVPPAIKDGSFDWAVTKNVEPVSQAPSLDLGTPVSLIVIGIVTLVMIILTIIILIRLPKTVAKAEHTFIQQTTELVVPIITHHKKLPAKKRMILSQRTVLAIQLIFVIVAFAVGLFISATGELTKQVIVAVASFLATISIIGFVSSWLLAPTSRTRSRVSRG